MIVQRGLEQIRTLKNQGMHPKLVIHLATNFGQKVEQFFKGYINGRLLSFVV